MARKQLIPHQFSEETTIPAWEAEPLESRMTKCIRMLEYYGVLTEPERTRIHRRMSADPTIVRR